MVTKAYRTVLGAYSFVFISYAIISALKNGFSPYLLNLFILAPLPLYFIIITIRELRHLYHYFDYEFVIDGYSLPPAGEPTAPNLNFLFAQTSPSFLVTVCLFSTAISATIIRAFLIR